MGCCHPLQAVFAYKPDGKKMVYFCNVLQDKFVNGDSVSSGIPHFLKNGKLFTVEGYLTLPCGKCITCKLEHSRQWAVRMVHEAQMHSSNCFVTLTYAPEYLPENGSLDKTHVQKFMKRLRKHFSDRKIGVYYCGEYGERFARPHYHLCLFNLDFPDKVESFSHKKNQYYNSKILSKLWPFGRHEISDLNFLTAAYVARYCTKKITGKDAEKHYDGRVPEFSGMSLKPALGLNWILKYGETDVWPYDHIVINGRKAKPPRYYDKVLERIDPVRYEALLHDRYERSKSREPDTHQRLLSREQCKFSQMKNLERVFEQQYA